MHAVCRTNHLRLVREVVHWMRVCHYVLIGFCDNWVTSYHCQASLYLSQIPNCTSTCADKEMQDIVIWSPMDEGGMSIKKFARK